MAEGDTAKKEENKDKGNENKKEEQLKKDDKSNKSVKKDDKTNKSVKKDDKNNKSVKKDDKSNKNSEEKNEEDPDKNVPPPPTPDFLLKQPKEDQNTGNEPVALNQLERREIEEEDEIEKRYNIEERYYTIFEIDKYVYATYKNLPRFYLIIAESIIVYIILTTPAWITCIFRESAPLSILSPPPETGDTELATGLLRWSNFSAVSYICYILTAFIAENSVGLFTSFIRYYDLQVFQDIPTYLIEAKSNIAFLLFCFLESTIVGVMMRELTLENFEYNPYAVLSLLTQIGVVISIALLIVRLFVTFLFVHVTTKSFRPKILKSNTELRYVRNFGLIADAKTRGEKYLINVLKMIQNENEPQLVHVTEDNAGLTSAEAAKNMAKSIYRTLFEDGISQSTLKSYFRDDYVKMHAFLLGMPIRTPEERSLLRKKKGKMDDLKNCFQSIYNERNDLLNSIHDNKSVIQQLNDIMSLFTIIVTFLIFATVINVNAKAYLVSAGTGIGYVGWVFSETVIETYKCFFFVLVSHPFDVGDGIIVDGQSLTVYSIGLVTTTFLDTKGVLTYHPTIGLVKKPIKNIRRSKFTSNQFNIKLTGNVNVMSLNKFKKELTDYVTETCADFTGALGWKSIVESDEKVLVTVNMEYASTLHPPTMLDIKSKLFKIALIDIANRSCLECELTK